MLKSPANGIILESRNCSGAMLSTSPEPYTDWAVQQMSNDNTLPVKPCFKCGVIQSLEDFNKDGRTPDGRTGECKACRRLRSKREQHNTKYRAEHTDEYYQSVLASCVPEKRCPTCTRVLPFKDFGKNRCTKDGFQNRCRECQAEKEDKGRRRRNRLKQQYGITVETYDALLKKQGGVCAICQKECAVNNTLAVDHSHVAGHVRGLLCAKCNQGIGLLGDDPAVMERALNYLLRL